MKHLLPAIRRTWPGLTSAPMVPPDGAALSRLDLLDARNNLRWHGPDPAVMDGRHQRDARLGGAS